MKTLAVITLMYLCCGSAFALTPAERAIVQHIGDVNKRQATELSDVKAKLVWVDKELKDTQPKIEQLGKERDAYKGLYEKDHEKVLKDRATILKLYIVIGLMTLAIGAYAFLKFYLHLPI